MSYAYKINGAWYLILCSTSGHVYRTFAVSRYIEALNMAKTLQVHFVETDGKEVINGQD